MGDILLNISYFLVIYFLIVNTFYAVLIVIAIPNIYIRFREVRLEDFFKIQKTQTLPSMGILIPAFNEEKGVIAAIRNAQSSFYPQKEILIINDGSTDQTLQKIIDEYDLIKIPDVYPKKIQTKPIRNLYRSRRYPEIMIVDKENGGRGDALNAGLNHCTSELFVTMDVDTILERDSLLRMIRPFLTYPGTLAQGGTLRILNGCEINEGEITKVDLPHKWVPAIQVVEYLRAFLYGRLGWNALGGNIIVSGAFGLFNRKVVANLGGYDPVTIGEDFELTLRIQKYARENNNPRAVHFIPDPVAWTYAPDKLKWIARQRTRWHQGLIEGLSKYYKMIFNPRYGMVGMIGIPYMVIGELIEPIFEFVGFVIMVIGLSLGYIPIKIFVYFLLFTYGITTFLTIISTLLEMTTFRRYRFFPQLLKMFVFSFLENAGYRQLYVLWRLKAFYMHFAKKKKW